MKDESKYYHKIQEYLSKLTDEEFDELYGVGKGEMSTIKEVIEKLSSHQKNSKVEYSEKFNLIEVWIKDDFLIDSIEKIKEDDELFMLFIRGYKLFCFAYELISKNVNKNPIIRVRNMSSNQIIIIFQNGVKIYDRYENIDWSKF